MPAAPAPASNAPALVESYFPSKDGTQLYLASYAPAEAKAHVLVLHGYDDHIMRYQHVLEALAGAGFAAHGLDYRGHGRAGGKRGYCANFSDFHDDFAAALAKVKAEAGSKPVFVVAHSHGCLVAATYAISRGADGVKAMVFSSPYFRLRIVPSWFQLFQAKVVGKIVPFLGVKDPITVEMLTHDKHFQELTAKDPLHNGIVTPKWFTESNAAQEGLFREAKRFTLPLLAMQGADDPVADPTGAGAFVDASGSSDKKLTMYPGMLHEIFMEVERAKPIAEAIAWLDAHVGGAA